MELLSLSDSSPVHGSESEAADSYLPFQSETLSAYQRTAQCHFDAKLCARSHIVEEQTIACVATTGARAATQ